MRELRVQDAVDHNRGLWPPMRWALAGRAALSTPFGVLTAFIACILLLMPLDGVVSAELKSLGRFIRGDVRRELNVIQQFGGVVSLVAIGLIILRLDTRRRRVVLDMALVAVLTGLTSFIAKAVIGRARPVFAEPWTYLGPAGSRATTRGPEPVYAWQFWEKGSSEFWSMPSSHSSAAFALATFLALTYPRLRLMAFAVATMVGVYRVIQGAHWPSDVLGGACVGCCIAWIVVRNRLGQRLLGGSRRSDPTSETPQRRQA